MNIPCLVLFRRGQEYLTGDQRERERYKEEGSPAYDSRKRWPAATVGLYSSDIERVMSIGTRVERERSSIYVNINQKSVYST